MPLITIIIKIKPTFRSCKQSRQSYCANWQIILFYLWQMLVRVKKLPTARHRLIYFALFFFTPLTCISRNPTVGRSTLQTLNFSISSSKWYAANRAKKMASSNKYKPTLHLFRGSLYNYLSRSLINLTNKSHPIHVIIQLCMVTNKRNNCD